MDKHILQQLYEMYGREILLYLYSICGSYHTAEDLLQETFVKALLSLSAQHSNMRAWLYLVARNLCLNEVKREKRSLSFVEEGAAGKEKLSDFRDGILEGLILKEDHRILYRAMARLPSIKREILLLQYFSGMSLREIAKILQISPENARVLSCRAKKELKKYLKEEGYEVS